MDDTGSYCNAQCEMKNNFIYRIDFYNFRKCMMTLPGGQDVNLDLSTG